MHCFFKVSKLFLLAFILTFSISVQESVKYPVKPNVNSETNQCALCTCCALNNCANDGKCLKGCIDSYHGNKCKNKCPSNCVRCTDHSDPWMWNTANCTTENCKEGYYSTETAYQCHEQCPYGCTKCISATDCKSCRSGYKLIQQSDNTGRCIICPENCMNCDTSGECFACESGYFPNQQSCSKCFENCNYCINSSSCMECKTGFTGQICDKCVAGKYGTNCDRNCSTNCNNRICERDSGNCFSCSGNYNPPICNFCKDGFYGSDCEYQCSVNCAEGKCHKDNGHCIDGCKLNFTGQTCDICAVGYYGGMCHSKCPNKCNGTICERKTGNCYSCMDNFNGSRCDACKNGFYLNSYPITHSSICQVCLSTCKTCISQDSCTDCEDNFEGEKCDNCITGMYGETCTDTCPKTCKTKTCDRFSGNCDTCLPNFVGNRCENCTNGYHGPFCNSSCPIYCEHSTCDRNSGSCSRGCLKNFEGDKCDSCILGKYGENCTYACPLHCLGGRCNRTTGLCAACKENFNGSTCEDCRDGKYGMNCTKECSHTCLGQKCKRDDGVCVSCGEGIYGLLCETKCSTFCERTTCDQASGNCSCKSGYSGDKCCLNNSFCETCDHDGNCIGCVDTMYGKKCESNCPKNCYGRCNITDGACFSCKDGFVGTDCTKSDKQIGEKLPIAAIAGGAAGGIVLFILGGLLAFFLYRRKNSMDTAKASIINGQTEKEFKESNVYVNQISLNRVENEKGASGKRKQQPSDIVDHGDIEMNESGDEAAEPPVQENEYINTVRRIQTIRLAEYVGSKEKEFFDREFKELPKGMQKPHNAAKKPENQGKCRYGSIYPYDDTRVKLKGLQTDFINASYINGYRKPKEYIACLGPTLKAMDNFVTFWHMVWQEKSDIIVMVTNLMEKGGMKCEQYWPAIGTVHAYGGVNVTCHSEDNYADYTIRSFTLSKDNEQRRLHHIHFTAWPDKGVPDDVTSLIEFRQRVRATDVILGGPIIVHCSAGVGRTGTYIALNILTQEGETENNVNIFGCVFNLRHQRTTMVQTVEQYEYLHRALVHSLTYGCEPIPAEEFQEYVNTCSDALMNSKFDKLRTTKEHVSEDENDAIVRNKALTDVNRKYADVPGDMYRPRLYKFKVMGESDFINATFVNSFKQKNRYIVCQTPLPATVEDFLTLVLQENVTCIVSLDPTTTVRGDVGQYIPADNRVLIVGHFEVSTTKATTVAGSYTYRRITVKIPDKTGAESKDVHHYQFNNWSDRQKVPGDPTKFLKLITDTEKQSDEDGRSGHIIVHCLNAAERSGLFCAVSILLQKMEIEHEVSVVNTLRQVKIRRQLAIPNKEQYVFCHQCVSAYLQTFDSSEYANFTPKF